MTCKKHASDPGIGICPWCLREKLAVLVAAQAKTAVTVRDRRKTDPLAPLSFPCSVSPYICGRPVEFENDFDLCPPTKQMFYSTPQVNSIPFKKRTGRLSVISSMFSTRSDINGKDSRDSRSSKASSSSSSSSWFSMLFFGRRKKKTHFSSIDETSITTDLRHRQNLECEIVRTKRNGIRKEEYELPYSSKTINYMMEPMSKIYNRSGPSFAFSPMIKSNPNDRTRRPVQVSSPANNQQWKLETGKPL